MFYNIGSEDDQSVFTRMFSALPIALIVQRHRQNPFFNQAEIEQLMHAMGALSAMLQFAEKSQSGDCSREQQEFLAQSLFQKGTR